MLFSSLTFLFGFLPILLILYFIIKNRKYKNVVLLIFSLLFYAWGEPRYPPKVPTKIFNDSFIVINMTITNIKEESFIKFVQ